MPKQLPWQPRGFLRQTLHNCDSISELVGLLCEGAPNTRTHFCIIWFRHTIIPLLCASIRRLLLAIIYSTEAIRWQKMLCAPQQNTTHARTYHLDSRLMCNPHTNTDTLELPSPAQFFNRYCESLRVVDIGRRTQPTSKANRERTAEELRTPNKGIFPWTVGCLSVCLASAQKRKHYRAGCIIQAKTSYEIL